MLRHERLSVVLELVAQRGSLSVDDLIDTFGVSAATARRDLDDLSAQQLITRTRGGAIAHTVTYDLPLRYKGGRQTEQKRRIAAAAADLVEAGSIVGLNGGTTTTEVARNLATRSEFAGAGNGSATALTVVTNALNIAHELAVRPTLKVVIVGGVLRPQTYELIGPFARPVLDGMSIDLTFLGVDAVSVDNGAAARHEGEAQINASMVDRSGTVVVVADSSKLGQRAFCTICPADRIDVLVTDTDAAADVLEPFRERGVQVITA